MAAILRPAAPSAIRASIMTNEVYIVTDSFHPDQLCVFSSLKNAIAYAKDYAEDEIESRRADSYVIEMDDSTEISFFDHEELLASIEYKSSTKSLMVQLCAVDEYLPE